MVFIGRQLIEAMQDARDKTSAARGSGIADKSGRPSCKEIGGGASL